MRKINFLKNKCGNFGLIFAILAVPLIGSAGLAIDYTNASRIRSHMQNAADTAALMAAKEIGLRPAERRALARQVAGVHFENDYKVNTTTVTITDEDVTVAINGTPKTNLMQVMGFAAMDVGVTSTARIAVNEIEIVFALDVSGSMKTVMSSGLTRMEELKNAANTLIDKVGASTVAARTKVGIVPFNVTVNVGKDRTSLVRGRGHRFFNGTEWKGCVFERAAPNHIRDNPGGRWTAYAWPPMPDVVGTGDWGQNPSDGTANRYATMTETTAAATDFAVNHTGPNFNCVRHPLMPLNEDLNAVKSQINTLTAEFNNGTLIAPGVTWAMRLLSPEPPFSEGRDWNSAAEKIMVVVTDGEQVTEAEFSGDGVSNASTNSGGSWSFDPSEFDLGGSKIDTGFGPVDNITAYGFIRDSQPFSRTATDWEMHKQNLVNLSDDACREAKRARNGRSIEIFTIGVSAATAPGTLAYDALHNCASEPDNHFYVEDSDDLDRAFQKIEEKLTSLRISS